VLQILSLFVLEFKKQWLEMYDCTPPSLPDGKM